MRKSKVTKALFVMSVYVLLFWGVLGTSATVAWFSDTTPTAKNSFEVGILDLEVFFKNDETKNNPEPDDYVRLTRSVAIFNENAIYEPGYTQVVYLRIENNQTVPFQYKVAVNAIDFTESLNKYNVTFTLPPHLRYGIVFGTDEAELDRKLAQALADKDMEYLENRLNVYSEYDSEIVRTGEKRYAALVVYMPESVGNEANHHPNWPAPTVNLGVTVYAQHAGTPLL